jgi:hypothetical protein
MYRNDQALKKIPGPTLDRKDSFREGSLISSLTYLEDKFTVRAAGIPVTSRREAASRLPS